MNTLRTPTKIDLLHPSTQPIHYGSDPALNKSTDTEFSNSDSTNITRRVKRKNDGPIGVNNDSIMSEMRDLLSVFCQKQDRKFDNLTTSLHSVQTQNSEILKSMEFMSQKYDDLIVKLDTLQQENKTFKAQIKSLEHQLELSEKKSRATSIEIRNFSKVQKENKHSLSDTVKKIGAILKQPIQDIDIRDVYRLKSKSESHNSIVVEFNSVALKENLIKSTRTYNLSEGVQPLNTSQVGLPGPAKPLYITEFLTTTAKHLHYLARKYKKTHEHCTCWTAYGKVYLRQGEGMPAVLINSEKDLADLK